jgi:hypothetical protein
LDFSPAPAELFGGRDMGEDALRLLGIYLAELKPVLATVAAQSAVLGKRRGGPAGWESGSERGPASVSNRTLSRAGARSLIGKAQFLPPNEP